MLKIETKVFDAGIDARLCGTRFGSPAEMEVSGEHEQDFIGRLADFGDFRFFFFGVRQFTNDQKDGGDGDSDANGPDQVYKNRDRAGDDEERKVGAAGFE